MRCESEKGSKPKGSGDFQRLISEATAVYSVRKGLEAERLWRLHILKVNCYRLPPVRKGLEAERLWRPKWFAPTPPLLFVSPKRARSRKAVATSKRNTDVSPPDRSEKGSKPKGCGDPSCEFLPVNRFPWSEKGSKPKGSGDVPSAVMSKRGSSCPKRARSRKAVATRTSA